MREWKTHIAFPLYEVSSKGEIRRVIDKSYKKPTKGNHGYYQVTLYNEGQKKDFLVHRLVAELFIPNQSDKRTVNHIDGDKSNNSVENLEWATYSENHKHSYDSLNRTAYMTGRKNELNHNSKPVEMNDINNNLIKRFPSISEAERETGILNNSIVNCLKKRTKTAGGYKWNYAR